MEHDTPLKMVLVDEGIYASNSLSFGTGRQLFITLPQKTAHRLVGVYGGGPLRRKSKSSSSGDRSGFAEVYSCRSHQNS